MVYHLELNHIIKRGLTSAPLFEPIALSQDDGRHPDGMTKKENIYFGT